MRTILCTTLSLSLVAVVQSSFAQGEGASNSMRRHGNHNPNYNSHLNEARRPLHINPNFPQAAMTGARLPKGAIHLMIRSDDDARQIFTYFPSPEVAATAGTLGVYRLEVNSQGTVAAVTILKSMGPSRDARVMKTCVGWRAKSGPLRIVDISLQMS